MLKYLLALVLFVLLLMFTLFRNEEPKAKEATPVKTEKNIPEPKEESVPEVSEKKTDTPVQENKKTVTTHQKKTSDTPQIPKVEVPKKELLGGADIEWIEPEKHEQTGAFGKPPMQ